MPHAYLTPTQAEEKEWLFCKLIPNNILVLESHYFFDQTCRTLTASYVNKAESRTQSYLIYSRNFSLC